MRPRLLDLFCGAGGASQGYADAGFDVVGVDVNPQPRYPFEFYCEDAMTFPLGGFDAIHASPPCQMFTAYRRVRPQKGDEHYVNLIPATRERLRGAGVPYVIENVVGAPLENPIMLCGSGFALDVQRHRLFESNVPMMGMPCVHGRNAPDRFPGGRSRERTGSSRGLVRATVEVGTWDTPVETQERAMGISWMTLPELSQAIPPAYTEFIGRQLLLTLPVSGGDEGNTP